MVREKKHRHTIQFMLQNDTVVSYPIIILGLVLIKVRLDYMFWYALLPIVLGMSMFVCTLLALSLIHI